MNHLSETERCLGALPTPEQRLKFATQANSGRFTIGELHTMTLTPQQWVRVRRLARKKMSIDIERRRWSLFFKDINPRQPAPGPDYGILM